jgi:hypothetical protein
VSRLADDLVEAGLLLERHRRDAAAAAAEALERGRRADAHAGGPLDPRAQGLRDAAAFHAARAREARERLGVAERRVAELRARAAAAVSERVRPCG